MAQKRRPTSCHKVPEVSVLWKRICAAFKKPTDVFYSVPYCSFVPENILDKSKLGFWSRRKLCCARVAAEEGLQPGQRGLCSSPVFPAESQWGSRSVPPLGGKQPLTAHYLALQEHFGAHTQPYLSAFMLYSTSTPACHVTLFLFFFS